MVATLSKRDLAMGRRMIGYRDDPVGYFRGPLQEEHVWPKMVEVLESVRDNQLTAVHACHSVSKTYLAGRVVVWFKACFQPSTVVTTAPSDNLVRNQLWREIHAAYAAAGGQNVLGGNMTSLMWDCKPSPHIVSQLPPKEAELWEKNFAIGFSTTPDQAAEHATKIQGFHNKWVLVVLDEACGLLPQIWKTVLVSLVTNERVKVLAIGNPTDPSGYFAKVCRAGSGWNVINIAVQDTPNYIEGREVVPSVAGRDYEQRLANEYGRDSNTYRIRVLGQFPTHAEGAFYSGPFDAVDKQNRVTSDLEADLSLPVYTCCDPGYHWPVWFFQVIGEDVHFLDCYEEIGLGVEGHVDKILRMGKERGYRYGAHFAPIDTESNNAYKTVAGKSLAEHAAENGLDFEILTPEYRVIEGIERTRQMLFHSRFNSQRCELGLLALRGYSAKKITRLSTEDRSFYTDSPESDYWGVHLCDAVRYVSLAVAEGRIASGRQPQKQIINENRHLNELYSSPYVGA